ncbi:MAG: prolipoprotein diacylglyceryl transferase [Rhizobiales bacterium 24-66-13]|jgi:phosphatidylglycerol:prolipoprotein diacylglycerol transferase|uniref:prolipoprotein diacylglyceryl transferase n=1 Tax=Roseixanthobacter finlandensis TaxID=3119922 RepID=UPI000BD7EED5|nr:MAG: prolipoprotein diacylglyceryl transferase [Rhizobiales bacterium 35-66-30]OYZ71626.1 MAG: prolipoprotein diacylglyceryl transferase [Rhizobiales bacterium 24-66-13]OZB06056.1 MAG: prolipoprotein diacylglyceryl transferase [Rhizobiales bacterium 39-66-18]HQS09543.1 prolipoprotein diacylglyceryl transferase [Xanthobacteraceae bacterium]HQS47677.1 prolipoprotein diacylglyceryl transferase [Xanthobacteraceae bacterium]
MINFAIPFPALDPVLIEIGPLAIRWYALAYIAGLLIGWQLARWLVTRNALWGGRPPMKPVDLDDALFWATFGVILGGRIGYVLFYNLPYFLAHPAEIVMVWKGGMSFHGGLAGTILALVLFARSRRIPVPSLLDVAGVVAPIGLFFGRIANFINGELWGRPSDAPWAVIFPTGGNVPRHPSQLYEAAMEGVLLFLVMLLVVRLGGLRRPGLAAGIFGIGYGLGRITGEFFREPDPQVGYLAYGTTMGMILSLPVVIAGLGIVIYALSRPVHGFDPGPQR